MKTVNRDRLMLTLSMLLFGTIGVFRKNIALPSGLIACARGLAGAAVLYAGVKLTGARFSREAIRRNLWKLVLSGAMIGFNWMLLFEAYRYTSIAVATLMYYMAPVIVIVASGLLSRGGLGVRRLACVAVAVAGMVLVSGVVGAGLPGRTEISGIAFGLGAAVLYACVMLLNGRMRDIGAYDRTVVQLFMAGLVMVPYVLLSGEWRGLRPDGASVALLVMICVLHTGVAYALYFGSMAKLEVQTVAMFSYIDPVTAVFLSAVLPDETLTAGAAIGAVLILGATMAYEMTAREA
ncbi:MAG: DMT family transporter [Clostridiales bacterium]|nr:DMT family transporter [Clostridiales bacterium]